MPFTPAIGDPSRPYTKRVDLPLKILAPNGYYVNTKIDADRWNGYYPYQLMVVTAKAGAKDTTYKMEERAVFTLPISPQDLTMQLPFASLVTPTFGGVVEDNSGAPFRLIHFSGTTGLQPFRKKTDQAGTPGILESVFSGTIEAAQNLADSARSLAETAGLVNKAKPPNIHTVEGGLAKADNQDGIPFESTGYYQFRLLEQFLETYAAMKASGVANDKRLVFANHKDESFYVVTPISFQLRRNASSPHEYNYSIQLKAWRRIELNASVNPFIDHKPAIRDSGIMGDIANTVNQARETVAAASNVLDAALGDVDRILNIAREVALLAKDVAGLAKKLVDFPGTLVNHVTASVKEIKDIIESLGEDFSAIGQSWSDLWSGEAFGSSGPVSSNRTARPSIPSDKMDIGAPAVESKGSSRQSSNDFLKKALLKANISQLALSPKGLELVSAEIDRVRALTRVDYENRRKEVIEYASNYADLIGAGNDTYSDTYSRRKNTTRRQPKPSEMSVLGAVQQIAASLDRLAASTATDSPNKPSSLEYVQQLADRSNIEFILPRSKFAIPFPYGATLESLAQQYLGTPDRWHEIAALNKLRAPYVDEVGFTLPLLVNGDRNKLVVSDSSQLYVGQTIWVLSDTEPKDKRHIEGIKKIAESNYIIVLDGNSNLDKFTLNDNAYIHTFFPNTVNSNSLIFIPSKDDPTPESEVRFVPGVNDYDHLLEIGGIDLLLDSKNDLVLTDGDAQFAFGLANIIQTIRLGLATPKNSLLRHPSYGIAVQIGDSHADVSAEDILKSVQDTFVNDPTFTQINAIQIEKTGPTVRMSIAVGITGLQDVLPVSFALVQP